MKYGCKDTFQTVCRSLCVCLFFLSGLVCHIHHSNATHAKYQMWPPSDFCHEIQNKYKHEGYTLDSGNSVVTKGKSSQMMDSSMSPRRSLSSFHLKWEMVTFTKHYPTKILDNLPPSINPSRIKVTIASMFISG